MSETPTVPPIVNSAMKFILRSPLHWMISKNIMLITFTGRKSGKTYTTPVGYSQRDGQVYVFTHATWWKNLQNGTPVRVRVRGRDLQGLAEPIVEDKRTIAAKLSEHLKEYPTDAKWYGVTFDENKNPRADQVEKGAQSVVMLRIQLC